MWVGRGDSTSSLPPGPVPLDRSPSILDAEEKEAALVAWRDASVADIRQKHGRAGAWTCAGVRVWGVLVVFDPPLLGTRGTVTEWGEWGTLTR